MQKTFQNLSEKVQLVYCSNKSKRIQLHNLMGKRISVVQLKLNTYSRNVNILNFFLYRK